METQALSLCLSKQAVHEKWRPFSKVIELKDDNNILLTQTDEGQSCIIASLASGNKNQHALYITRYYSFQDPYNVTLRCPLNKNVGSLKPNVTIHSVSQVCTDHLAVSIGSNLELFEVMTGTCTRIIKTDCSLEFLVRVNPLNFAFAMEHYCSQEACIGFSGGSFIKLGFAEKI